MIIVILIMGIIMFYFYIEKARFISIMPVLGLFVVCAQRLFQNLGTLFSQRMVILSYLPSLILVHELIKSRGSRHDTEGRQSFEELSNGILFEDVVFSYTKGEPLFEGLNLEFRKGLVTAMAGPSGSGKSTI